MARPADFDLAKELAKPSFTPAQRDAPALAELVIAGAEPAAGRAATALSKLAARGLDAIRARLDAAPAVDDGAAARLVSALGQLARTGDAAARSALLARTGDTRVRVRRSAIAALGKLDGDVGDARDALIARWDADDVPPDERRALAEALGKLGGDAAIDRLRSATPGDDGELVRRRDRGLLMAERAAKRDLASAIRVDVPPPAPLAVRLGCKPGLAPLLGEELTSIGIAHRLAGDATIELTLAAPWQTLFDSRLWATAKIALPFTFEPVPRRPRRADQVADPDRLATAIVSAITAPATRALLAAWTDGAIRWRLGFARGHKRAIVWRVARDVGIAAPELINDPTATTWELEVDVEAATLALIPRRADDPRFDWRVAEIPAASHPSVAAALAWVVQPGPQDRVWDPFCGSGAELVECARRGARAVIGSDLDPGAIEAARANLTAAGIDAELAIADARTHDPGEVTAIVTNPPLGSRVRVDAGRLLIEAIPHLAGRLAPGGRLVWITPSPRRTSPAALATGLSLSRALELDLGGVHGRLERWQRS